VSEAAARAAASGRDRPGPTHLPLRVGAGRADITPDWPVSLAGFAVRTGRSTGVAHRLHVRAIVVERGPRRVLVVSADLLNWSPERLPGLRSRLTARCGIAPDAMVFAATHNHSAPATTRWMAPSIGVLDSPYADLLEARTVAAVTDAIADLEEVTVANGIGTFDLGMHRRTVVDGRAIARPNPDGPADHDISVLAYRRRDGSLKAALTHYTCHPVLSREPVLTGEFTGYAMDTLEERTGATCLYLQGCCGDVNPGRLGGSGITQVPVQGERLADAVGAVLASLPAGTDGSGDPGARWATAQLPFDQIPTPAELTGMVDRDGIDGEWARTLLTDLTTLRPSATLLVQRLDLGGGIDLLTFNGEVTVAYGLRVKARSGGTVWPVGYANGMLGYLPTAQQLADGGYEADESTRYYLLPGRFARSIEQRINDTADSLLRAD